MGDRIKNPMSKDRTKTKKEILSKVQTRIMARSSGINTLMQVRMIGMAAMGISSLGMEDATY